MKICYLFLIVIFIGCTSSDTKKAMMTFEIVGNGVPRFDKAPSYILLIKETVPGSGFKDSIKSIINEFAAKQRGGKFSINIYDDPDVAKVVLETIVKQSRQYTREESKQMNLHWVASYTGELMFEGKSALEYEHELSFFPDIKHAIKSGPKVNLQETIEYLPK